MSITRLDNNLICIIRPNGQMMVSTDNGQPIYSLSGNMFDVLPKLYESYKDKSILYEGFAFDKVKFELLLLDNKTIIELNTEEVMQLAISIIKYIDT